MSGSVIRGSNDPDYVRRQYKNELGLRARKAVYGSVGGPDARDIALAAVREASPARILEVGCGEGEFSARLAAELGDDVVALDQSARMVELARVRGVDARVGDVQELPFADGSFDVAVAAWMLYHVPQLDRALRELARVLVPGGRLVAITNRQNHLEEMFRLVGVERWELAFGAENGAEILASHFARVELRDATGIVTFPDAELIRAYLRSSERLSVYAGHVPELERPLVAHRRPVVFVANKAP